MNKNPSILAARALLEYADDLLEDGADERAAEVQKLADHFGTRADADVAHDIGFLHGIGVARHWLLAGNEDGLRSVEDNLRNEIKAARTDGPLGPHTGPSSPGSDPTPQPPHTERDGGELLEAHIRSVLQWCDDCDAADPEDGKFHRRAIRKICAAAHPTPPGPVAGWRNIAEPLGCPTPGACMCPKPVQTRENLARSICRGMWPDHAEMYERNGDVRWADCLRAAEALSALPPEPPVESGED